MPVFNWITRLITDVPAGDIGVGGKEIGYMYGMYKKLRGKPLLASHVISIGMKRDELQRVPEIEEIEAVACAVQNMSLTASAYGLGCYWGSGGITYVDGAKEFFGLEAKDKLLGFLFIGVPKKIPDGRRESLDDKVKWIT